MVNVIRYLQMHQNLMDIVAFVYNCFHGNKGYLQSMMLRGVSIKGVFMTKTNLVCAKNAKLHIGRRTQLHNCKITLTGENSSLFIKGTSTNINNASFTMAEKNSIITIGKSFTMQGGCITSLEGASITIGNDCMFSGDIDIASGDHHTILDYDTRERINPSKSIIIADHVWLGAHARVLKGSLIPEGCIIGNSSVVSSILGEKHAIYVGIPAKLKKKNIDWNRERIK